MRALIAGAAYFALVFGAGFALGPIRVLWLEPRVGARTAEFAEAPLMVAVIALAARWIVLRFAIPPAAGPRLGVGATAVALMIAAEAGLVLPLRGLSIGEYLATRDPLSGTVYYAMLVLMTLLPVVIAGKKRDAT